MSGTAGIAAIDRRMLLGALGVGAALMPSAALLAQAAPAGRMLRIDALTIDGPWFDAGAARAAGMDGAVVDLTIYPRNREQALDALEGWRRAAAAPDAAFQLCLRADDIARAAGANRFAVILACQDAAILDAGTYSVDDGNLDNMDELHLRGLRLLQLTHNERNAVGDSFVGPGDAGLSRLGQAVVERAGRIGMLIDLSHCSAATTADAIARASRPVAVTHSGCRALYDSARNKSDQEIRALAERGGFFGVFMMTRWMTTARTSSVETVVDHIAHAVRVGGVATVGFGSDQPVAGDPGPQERKVAGLAEYQARNAGLPGAEPLTGHVTATDLDTARRMELLDTALAARGFAGAAREAILGGNFRRVFRDACG